MLLRHGQTGANAAGVLAGRSAGVALDDAGQRQTEALRERLRTIEFADVVSSPMLRCVATARTVTGRDPRIDERLNECDFGDWTGKALADLRSDPLWRLVQDRPGSMVFPGGESFRDVAHRAVTAVREHDARVVSDRGDSARWMAVTHADVIKCVVADAFGMHLDLFQRIVIDTCSITTISYTEHGPYVVGLNDKEIGARVEP